MIPPQPLHISKKQLLMLLAPLPLSMSILVYIAGVGTADYLGTQIKWPVFFLGLSIVILIVLCGNFLNAYFDPQNLQDLRYKESVRKVRIAFLQIALLFLTMYAALFILLINLGEISFISGSLIGLAILFVLLNTIPPFRLADRGLGEFIQAFLACTFAPMLGISLQTGGIHPLVGLFSLPFTFFCLAGEMALSLPDYAQEMKTGFHTMVGKLGWQSGMTLHNLLILSGLLLVVLIPLLGYAWGLIWPLLLCLPLGLIQIILFLRISEGAPPRWILLKILAYGLPILCAYLLNFGLWTR